MSHVKLEVRDSVAFVTLSRPPVNAVNQDMYREIRDLFLSITTLVPLARVVVLHGDGKHFCGGNDLHEFETLDPTNAAERMREVREAFFAVSDCPLPVVGAVSGVALGTGLALAASCDFVVAADDAKFGVPELSVGVLGGARHLARLVPLPILRWMYFTADPITANRLAALGGVIAVVPTHDLLSEATKIALRVARHSLTALQHAKDALNTIESMALKPGYEYEQSLTCAFAGHPDSREAVRAFFERRDPVYGRKEVA